MSPSFPPTGGRLTSPVPQLWPGVPLPIPGASLVDGAEVDGDSIVLGDYGGIGDPLPSEFILREALGLNPDDLDSAVGLICEFGELFQTELADLPETAMDDPTYRNVMLAREAEIARLGCLPAELYHKEEVRLHFEALCFLGETWLSMQTPNGLQSAVAAYLIEERAAQIKSDIKTKVNSQAWDYLKLDKSDSYETLIGMTCIRRIDRFDNLLDAGLSKFHIGLDAPEQRSGTVYSIACLQLYNLIVERATIRYCASETCGRRFVHQRGTAQYGQYRTAGVKYCSPACGKAQNERERRRRRARQA
jgi:hypothetical protein